MLGPQLQGLWASEAGGSNHAEWPAHPSGRDVQGQVRPSSAAGRWLCWLLPTRPAWSISSSLATPHRPHTFSCSAHRFSVWKFPSLQLMKFKVQKKGHFLCKLLSYLLFQTGLIFPLPVPWALCSTNSRMELAYNGRSNQHLRGPRGRE